MRVLYFHQYFSTPKGAAGTRSYEMAKHLISKGHSVTMVCGRSDRTDSGLPSNQNENGIRRGNLEGIDIIELPMSYSNTFGFTRRTLSFLQYAFRCVRLVFTEKYDVVFATSTPLTAGIPGIIMKLIVRKPFVFEVRDLWPELPREMGVINNPVILKLMSALEWASYHSADKCIGLSPGIKEGIERRGINSRDVQMIPNGCDIELFKPKPCSKNIFNISQINETKTVAIFTGAHGPANGLSAVLDAASELQKLGKEDIHIVLVGEGKEKKDLIQRAHDLKLENCHFLPGAPKTTIVKMLHASDIGLQVLKNIPAFYYGTSPNKFFDYLSAGLPVVNNYPGWVSDLITENNCGCAVAAEDPKEFARALVTLSEQQQLREEMGQNALTLAHKNFSRSKLAEEFSTVLKEAANG